MTDRAARDADHRTTSLLGAFLDHVERDPGGTAFRYLDGGLLPGVSLSRAEVDRRARAIAAALRDGGVESGRVLVLLPGGLDFLVAFFGCQYAGVAAVPCAPPAEDESDDRLLDVSRDAAISAVLTSGDIAADARKRWDLADEPLWVEVDALPDDLGDTGSVPEIAPENLALLQYTSGSTGRPKGVAASSAQLAAQLVNFRDLARLPAGGNVVSWMPQHHALGLGHLLLAQLVGGTATFMLPDDFVAAPHLWLEAISATEGPVLGGGPNFAYQRCVEQVTERQRESLDLGSWHAALIGGERIRPDTLERFARTFGPHGFRRETLFPAYGLTETMQIVTGNRHPDPLRLDVDAAELERGSAVEGGDRTQALVPTGPTGPNARLCIVDPVERTALPAGSVGEVWIDGPVVCNGYWQRPEETAEAFDAWLSDGSGPFLRTGDLGFLHGGELVICGRAKELVIINGRNLHPQDIELTSQRACPSPALPAAAFGIEAEEAERLVVVQAVYPAAHPDLPRLAERIRQEVAAEHKAPVHEVLLVAPDDIRTTGSGKVRRSACRDTYLAGEFEILARSTEFASAPAAVDESSGALREMVLGLEESLRPSVVSSEVRRRLAAALGVSAEEVPTDRPLAGLGVESLRTISLRHGVERDFGVELSTADFFRGSADEVTDALLRALRQESGTENHWPRLEADLAERHEPFPLTGLQQAYLVGRSTSYDLGGTSIHLYAEHDSADLDIGRLRLALEKLVQRQEMLRAVVSADGTQRILPEVPSVPIREYDLRGAGEQAQREHVAAVRAELGHQVIPLDTWPMFDIRVTWLDGKHALVHVSLDLLIFDVASVRLFFLEWGDLYQDPDAQLPELDVSFRDFVLAADEISRTEDYQRSKRYWMRRVETLPPAPELPLLPAEPGKPIRRRRKARLDAERWERLKDQAAELGVTPTSVLLAAYATALGTWSRTSHFTIDVPLFSRFPLHPHIERILGDFTSVSLLEVDLREEIGLAALAQQLQKRMWEDLEHRYFSGVEVMREAAKAQGLQPSAFASIVFASTREHGRDQAFEQGEWGSKWLGELVHGITQTPQVLLDHQVYEDEGSLTFNWDAVEQRFPEGMLDDVFGTYVRLLEELADRPGAWRPHGFTALPRWHRELIAAANDTAGPVPSGYLFSGIAEQALHHPERTAVVAADGTLTFGELYGHACRLARGLRSLGTRPNELVAVSADKSAAQVVAVLAAQLSGAAYLPLDPELPVERQDRILADAEVSLVLTRPGGPQRDWPSGVRALPVHLDQKPDSKPLPPLQQQTDLAYVLYTSGSTGTPKGVMQTHRATLNTLVDAAERMNVGPRDRALGLSSMSFDLSVWDVFGVLGAGATLVLPEPAADRDPARWLELMAEHRVSLWNSVPALMRMLLEHLGEGTHSGTATLRAVWFSGDWIPVDLPDQVRAVSPGARVIASGGPTETAIWCVANPLGEVDPGWDSIPYGRPMRNHTIHVLDEALRPCPVWCPGEMYIGGLGLAEGYWRDPARTEAAFITHPRTGERLYRSGDVGRWLDTGELEILGRKDFQVKIGGNRIELGEIESALTRDERVSAAAVTTTGLDRHQQRLVAFVVPNKTGSGAGEASHDELGAEITDESQRLEFKLGRPGLRTDLDGQARDLPVTVPDAEADEAMRARASHRGYANRSVPVCDLAGLLENLRARGDGALPKRRYASAGSLYPVQTYVYVAHGRVDGIDSGTYYYDPVAHRLVAISPGVELAPAIHVPDNRAMFADSAFTVFLVAQRHAIEPLYGRRARDFCLLEAGLMAQLLDDVAARWNLGLCQVGLVRETDQLREALALDHGHTVLHGLVGGARLPEDAATGGLTDQLREELIRRLPRYMVPATIAAVDALPLTARGKLDRKALQRMADDRGTRPAGVPPRDDLERTIVEVFQAILETDRIGVLHNFFDIGADSPAVVRAHRRLRAVLGRDFPLMTMFEQPNIRSLAEVLTRRGESTSDSTSGGVERAHRRAARRRTRRRA